MRLSTWLLWGRPVPSCRGPRLPAGLPVGPHRFALLWIETHSSYVAPSRCSAQRKSVETHCNGHSLWHCLVPHHQMGRQTPWSQPCHATIPASGVALHPSSTLVCRQPVSLGRGCPLSFSCTWMHPNSCLPPHPSLHTPFQNSCSDMFPLQAGIGFSHSWHLGTFWHQHLVVSGRSSGRDYAVGWLLHAPLDAETDAGNSSAHFSIHHGPPGHCWTGGPSVSAFCCTHFLCLCRTYVFRLLFLQSN